MKENDILLNNLFDNLTQSNISKNMIRLELFITPICNQNCTYCYLQKNKDYYYPIELRDSKLILSNLSILLNDFKKKNIKFKELHLYSGEIWASDFAYQIFDILLNYLKEYRLSEHIMIPSNMSFLLDKNAENYYRKLIDDFKKINVTLHFSASVDGLYLDNNFRSRNNSEKYSLDFYNTLFKFNKDFGFGFHPMVSSKSVKFWIENFDWFMSKFKEFNINSSRIMMLEVRNDDWEPENISDLLSFLDYEINWYLIHEFQNDKKKFAFALSQRHAIPSNINLCCYDDRMACAIQKTIAIRLGDLAWIPCHRTAYDDFVYGHFIMNDNNNLMLISKNHALANKIYLINPTVTTPQCNNCIYNTLCMKGCLGAQIESNKYLFTPCYSVCLMEQEKIKFLINKYADMGIFKIWEEYKINSDLLAEIAEVLLKNE